MHVPEIFKMKFELVDMLWFDKTLCITENDKLGLESIS